MELSSSGWKPEPRTVGLVVFGFSVVAAASGLVVANSELSAVFNVPPPGYGHVLTTLPYVYPLNLRVAAGSTFVEACAAAFVAAGGLGMCAAAAWGVWVSAIALAVEAGAVLVSMVVLTNGVLVIGRVALIVWLLTLIVVVTGYRPSVPRGMWASSDARSWMEDEPQ